MKRNWVCSLVLIAIAMAVAGSPASAQRTMHKQAAAKQCVTCVHVTMPSSVKVSSSKAKMLQLHHARAVPKRSLQCFICSISTIAWYPDWGYTLPWNPIPHDPEDQGGCANHGGAVDGYAEEVTENGIVYYVQGIKCADGTKIETDRTEIGPVNPSPNYTPADESSGGDPGSPPDDGGSSGGGGGGSDDPCMDALIWGYDPPDGC